MAKIVLYLHAENGRSEALVARAMELAIQPLIERHALQLAVMTPCAADLLAVPADSEFLAHLDVVLEIVFPVGCPEQALRAELHEALSEALKQCSPYPQAVQQILERRRDEKRQPPRLSVAVPDKVKHYSVKPASLAVYDKLNKGSQDD